MAVVAAAVAIAEMAIAEMVSEVVPVAFVATTGATVAVVRCHLAAFVTATEATVAVVELRMMQAAVEIVPEVVAEVVAEVVEADIAIIVVAEVVEADIAIIVVAEVVEADIAIIVVAAIAFVAIAIIVGAAIAVVAIEVTCILDTVDILARQLVTMFKLSAVLHQFPSFLSQPTLQLAATDSSMLVLDQVIPELDQSSLSLAK